MPQEFPSDLDIDTIQELLRSEEQSVQTLFKIALNHYVSNDAMRKSDDEKLDLLKKAIEQSIK